MVTFKMVTDHGAWAPKCEGFHLSGWCGVFSREEIFSQLEDCGCPPAVLGPKTETSQAKHPCGDSSCGISLAALNTYLSLSLDCFQKQRIAVADLMDEHCWR